MRECCRQCILQIQQKNPDTIPSTDVFLLIDGNDFEPFRMYDESTESMVEIPHETIEGGDNTYTSIAAASILAKVARDEYIAELCAQYPELDRRYSISKNKGYGTKQHMDGIREYGTCQWHRMSYGICKTAPKNHISTESSCVSSTI
jgi:ribonuclease HII